VAWAREEFRLAKPDKNGTSRRAHFEAAGVENPNPLPFPEAMAHVWGWFCDLASGRTCGMGPNPITWEGMAAWCTLTGNRPSPWEVRALRALDSAYLASTGD
jgi:hypothetical protein